MLRGLSLRDVLHFARRRLWSTGTTYGLRADLDRLPPRPAAKVPLAMEPETATRFAGFEDERARVAGGDAVEVTGRIRMCSSGIDTLYVARDDDGTPRYAQWLVRAEEQAPLHAAVPQLFPHLAPGEGLVEGAYTFVSSRRLGAMADGMHQLLERARDSGDRVVFTYVAEGNVPSLRGCASAGFEADHVRLTKRRLGVRRVDWRPLGEAEREAWRRAVAPRG